MSLRRRLVAGTLALLVVGVVTTDLVTSSSLRSFLYGRLDEQIDAAQDTAYNYIDTTYQRALAADVRTATSNHVTDEVALLVVRHKRRTHEVRPPGACGIRPMTESASLLELLVSALNSWVRGLGL